MRVESIQVGQPKPTPAGVPGAEPAPRLMTTAIWKEPVTGPVRLEVDGLDGDAQADRKHHGGLWRAVLMYPAEHYPRWRAEWGRDDVGPGGFELPEINSYAPLPEAKREGDRGWRGATARGATTWCSTRATGTRSRSSSSVPASG